MAVFALERPRAELCARIDGRVVRMFSDGLVAEVRALEAATRPPGPVAAQGVGYREVLDHLAGRATLERDDRPGPGPIPAVRQAAGDLVPWPGRGSALARRDRRAPRGDRRAAGRGDRAADRVGTGKLTFLDPPSSVMKPSYPGRPLRRVRRVPGCARVCFAPKGPRKASIGAVPKEGSRFPWTGDSSLFSSGWHWPCLGPGSRLCWPRRRCRLPSLPPVPPVEPAPLPAEALPPPAAMPPPNESPCTGAEAARCRMRRATSRLNGRRCRSLERGRSASKGTGLDQGPLSPAIEVPGQAGAGTSAGPVDPFVLPPKSCRWDDSPSP